VKLEEGGVKGRGAGRGSHDRCESRPREKEHNRIRRVSVQEKATAERCLPQGQGRQQLRSELGAGVGHLQLVGGYGVGRKARQNSDIGTGVAPFRKKGVGTQKVSGGKSAPLWAKPAI